MKISSVGVALGMWLHALGAFAQEPADEASIARELEQLRGATPAAPSQPPPITSVASARGLSSAFNPSISATMSLLAGGRTDSSPNIALQEVEFRLSAIVDPYLRADITLAGNAEEVGFEEAYLTTLSIPLHQHPRRTDFG